jgi:hypothetical protein
MHHDNSIGFELSVHVLQNDSNEARKIGLVLYYEMYNPVDG